MSRIGKQPIDLPAGVEVSVSADNTITVKGKLGELKQTIDQSLTVRLENNQVILDRSSEENSHRAKHGLYRALLNNMVKGVTEGFNTVQELVGVGYKADAKGQVLELSLGYSHNFVFILPQEIKVETVSERGKNPLIKMSCIDKQLLGQIAAKIRSLREPEPYKGKGIKFQNEVLRRKAGKTAGK
ncbi:MAG: 50S ribosomal protein L6 [Bacteroidales bacterium]|nr:50S ribosomal protein L6 [Bacteroidales bacterium]